MDPTTHYVRIHPSHASTSPGFTKVTSTTRQSLEHTLFQCLDQTREATISCSCSVQRYLPLTSPEFAKVTSTTRQSLENTLFQCLDQTREQVLPVSLCMHLFNTKIRGGTYSPKTMVVVLPTRLQHQSTMEPHPADNHPRREDATTKLGAR